MEIWRFGENASIRANTFAYDGASVITAGSDGTRVWDLTTKLERQRFEGRSSPLTDAQFSRNGRRVGNRDKDGLLHVWDLS